MWKTIKTGYTIAWNQPFVVCTLFIYNLLWGLALYELIRSIVSPLLHRYPQELSREAVHLFWIEAQFQITKTDLIHSYAWWGLCLLLARMLLSPLLNAGVYYSLEHTEMNAGYRFVQGMRELALPFFGLYVMQMLLTLSPLYWLIPKLIELYRTGASLTDVAKDVLLYLSVYLVYVFLLQTVFMYLQFGRTGGKSRLSSLLLLARNAFPVILIAVFILSVTLFISALVMTSAMIWTGFLALLGYQMYRLVHMFCKMWAITAQYALWSTHSD